MLKFNVEGSSQPRVTHRSPQLAPALVEPQPLLRPRPNPGLQMFVHACHHGQDVSFAVPGIRGVQRRVHGDPEAGAVGAFHPKRIAGNERFAENDQFSLFFCGLFDPVDDLGNGRIAL